MIIGSNARILVTPAAVDACPRERMLKCLRQHMTGRWGSMPSEDVEANDRALDDQGQIMSAWPIDPDRKYAGSNRLWIITDPGWTVTTILLPEDY